MVSNRISNMADIQWQTSQRIPRRHRCLAGSGLLLLQKQAGGGCQPCTRYEEGVDSTVVGITECNHLRASPGINLAYQWFQGIQGMPRVTDFMNSSWSVGGKINMVNVAWSCCHLWKTNCCIGIIVSQRKLLLALLESWTPGARWTQIHCAKSGLQGHKPISAILVRSEPMWLVQSAYFAI